jgi:glycine/D-amino acid oxidase-like deaminating enzyme
MNLCPQREFSVVGGGILGLMVAHTAHDRGFRDITVYESPGPLNLNCDTLRNHAWLQSGLLYAETNQLAAKIMWEWGRRMLRRFSVPIPQEKGVFRIAKDEGPESFYRRAEALSISSHIARIEDRMAEQILGPFFDTGFIHFWVPDAPFDEKLLLCVARERARALNIRIQTANVRLLTDSSSEPGYLLDIDGQRLESQYVALCAGAGLLSLLKPLRAKHPLAVFRSALLRVARSEVMRTPLLVDVSKDRPTSGLSVIQHSPKLIPPKGCLVVGSKDRTRLQPDDVERRVVPPPEDDNLQRLLPDVLRPKQRGFELRVVAGHKTEACDKKGKPSIDHWIGVWKNYPGLIAAVPGKATQALYVADQVLQKLLRKKAVPGKINNPPTEPPPGVESTYLPEPHHYPQFDGVLDELETEQRDQQVSGDS